MKHFHLILVTTSCFLVNAIQAATIPFVSNVSPTSGNVGALTQVTVVFSEAVTNVAASDLLVAGNPAMGVTGSGTTYTFTLERQPGYGTVLVSWDGGHGIYDLETPANRFDETAPSSNWQYNLVDVTAPVVSGSTPAAGVSVRQLTQFEVNFSEGVLGVDAADLLVNGSSAGGLSVIGGGRYLFTFAQPASGNVQITWAAGHGIRDFASPANAFAGGSWNYTLDPSLGLAKIRINEFTTSNINTNRLKDEDGDTADWIEIWNHGSTTVNLGGCALTDDRDDPGKWVFPATNLAAGQYIVVFASAKDRRTLTVATNRFHTNFKLNVNGNYLALFNAELPRVAITEFAPKYPEQRNDYSYGYDIATDTLKYFASPTPGAANGTSFITLFAPPVHFNVERGLFEFPFTLILNDAMADATIRYTLDGSEPTATNGLTYATPITINNTATVRATAFRTNTLPSITVTHTYVFLDQVLRQPNNPSGFPTGATVFTGFPSDYEMDPEIVTNSVYGPQLKSALKSLPVVSMVMKTDDLFGPVNGIYTHPEPSDAQRSLWERACSIELILTNGHSGFQVNCGVRMQGNASRTPSKTSKHPFRLMFRGDYGAGTLDYPVFPDSPVDKFDTLVLRADFNNSWLHWGTDQRLRGSRIRDGFGKDTWREMGQPGGHNRYCHLYLNGLYWGIYEFAERVDANFAASYFGGTGEDYDAMVSKPTEAIDGTRVAYDAMIAAVGNPDMRVLNNYVAAFQHLDVTNYIDYMLINFYGANQDWGLDGNWNAIRRRNPAGQFKYVVWDGEQLFVGTNDNRVAATSAGYPSGLHGNLLNSAEYRLAFADRVQKHLFNGGALSPNANIARWNSRAAQVDLAVIAESARWGDNRRDVMTTSGGGTAPFYLYTRNEYWLPEVDRMRTNYFPLRHVPFLQQLRTAGLFPLLSAPSFNQHGGTIARGFNLAITATNTIYFTLDGSDPRVFGTSAIAPGASTYSGGVILTNSVVVKARALFGTNWSALCEATFTVDALGSPLRITEIMYNPIGGEGYEFIELRNVSSTVINAGYYSIDYIGYIFPPDSLLQPGQVIVLAPGASGVWAARYPGVPVFGRFNNKLDNAGETLGIRDASGRLLWSVTYNRLDW